MNNLKLGQTLRDAVTGFTGIAVNKTTFLNGNIQYNLQQPVKEDGTYPDALSIDYHTLDVVDDGVSARVTEGTYQSPIQLGDKVRDIVMEIEGIATLKTEYLNGCTAFLVSSKLAQPTASGQERAEDWVDQTRLKVVNEGIRPDLQIPEKAANGKQPGGPVMRGIPRGC